MPTMTAEQHHRRTPGTRPTCQEVLRRSETWAKTGACVANFVIQRPKRAVNVGKITVWGIKKQPFMPQRPSLAQNAAAEMPGVGWSGKPALFHRQSMRPHAQGRPPPRAVQTLMWVGPHPGQVCRCTANARVHSTLPAQPFVPCKELQPMGASGQPRPAHNICHGTYCNFHAVWHQDLRKIVQSSGSFCDFEADLGDMWQQLGRLGRHSRRSNLVIHMPTYCSWQQLLSRCNEALQSQRGSQPLPCMALQSMETRSTSYHLWHLRLPDRLAKRALFCESSSFGRDRIFLDDELTKKQLEGRRSLI